ERPRRHVDQRHLGLVEVALALVALLEHLLVREQAEQLAPARVRETVGIAHVRVPEVLRALDEVARRALALLGRVLRRVVLPRARLARREPPVLAAAEDDVGTRG